MDDEPLALVMTTCGRMEDARVLARELVERGLAACVQMQEITSVYRWEGTIQEDPEILLFIKTRGNLYPEVEAFLREHHPYEVPEIVHVPITRVAPSYLQWVLDVTRGRDAK